MSRKVIIEILICMALLFSVPAEACRVPHTSPNFDAMILLEPVDASTRLYRVRVPAEMNGAPFFSLYLKYWDSNDDEHGNPSALSIKLEIDDNGLVGEFILPKVTIESSLYLQVNYQGPDDPCGTVAIRLIAGVG